MGDSDPSSSAPPSVALEVPVHPQLQQQQLSIPRGNQQGPAGAKQVLELYVKKFCIRSSTKKHSDDKM